MNEKNMRELLDRKPFLPLTITLSSVQTLTINHPENVLLTKTKIVVPFPDQDLITWAPLLHVAAVESAELVNIGTDSATS